MKNPLLFVLFFVFLIPYSILSQENKNQDNSQNNPSVLVTTLLDKDIKPKKSTQGSYYLKINYKKSNDIISIKAYRKSLKDKLRRKKLC